MLKPWATTSLKGIKMEYEKPSQFIEQVSHTIVEALEDGLDVNVWYIQKTITELLLDSNLKLKIEGKN